MKKSERLAKRFCLVLDDKIYEVLTRLAKTNGLSRSAQLRNLVWEARPDSRMRERHKNAS